MTPRTGNLRVAAAGTRSPVAGLELLEPRCLLSAAPWVIDGATAHADAITVARSADDPSRLEAVVNGRVVGTRPESEVGVIVVRGGGGADALRIDLSDAAIPARLYGGRGADTLAGGAGPDRLYGGPGKDSLRGEDGDDLLRGGRGGDALRPGGGVNDAAGGMGADWVYARRGADRLAADGADTLVDGENTDPLHRLESDAELRQWYVDTAVAQWKDLLGQPAEWWSFGWDWAGGWGLPWDGVGGLEGGGGAGGGAAEPDGADGGAAAPPPSGDHSGTNTQVQGVDESDLVETDGEYLYTLGGEGVIIVRAQPADDLAVVSDTAIDGSPIGMYLAGDRLTVVSQAFDFTLPPWLDGLPGDGGGGGVGIGLSGGADGSGASSAARAPAAAASDAAGVAFMPGDWGGWSRARITVTVLDVSDPAAPAVVESSSVDGSLLGSRSIDGRLYLVMQNTLAAPSPELVPAEDAADGFVYESEDAYRARLEAGFDDSLLPQIDTTSGGDETTRPLAAAPDIYLPANADGAGASLLSVAVFDTTDDTPGVDATSTAVGLGGEIYVSPQSLYVAAPTWWTPGGDWASGPRTNLYKFDLTSPGVPLVAAGAVPGYTINAYALDEKDGLLRIATTSADFSEDGAAESNNLFVLADDGAGSLTVTGGLTGLASDESIYAVRYVGDTAYVTTFHRVDPLWVIDLSDPEAPRVAGELEVPGYSTYLHPLDETHLLAIGRDADPQSGRTTGLQLSLFDTSDPAHPALVDTYRLSEDAWSGWSEAEWDPHAFSYFPEEGVLAVPIESAGGDGVNAEGDAGGFEDWLPTTKLEVFRVDPAEGFTRLGEVEHEDAIRRSVRIDSLLYSVSAGRVKVSVIEDGLPEVATVSLPAPPGAGEGWWDWLSRVG